MGSVLNGYIYFSFQGVVARPRQYCGHRGRVRVRGDALRTQVPLL